MTDYIRLKNLEVPKGRIDVVLDTDAYNEIDDQFAISYLLRSCEKINAKAIYAAPFFNGNSENPKDGMEKSYLEIKKLLKLLDENVPVFKGAESYLEDEKTPVISDSARDLAERAMSYSPENPLYVVAIGAITNIASAMLLNPMVGENCVLVWLGGHARHYSDTKEFNMMQDIAAARVAMSGKIPLVQLPCGGVVSSFIISKPELEFWFKGKSPIADYLAENTIKAAEKYAKGKPWTRCIWDVTAVAWLLNDNDRFMKSRLVPSLAPSYGGYYENTPDGTLMRYVYFIDRDNLLADLIMKITGDVL